MLRIAGAHVGALRAIARDEVQRSEDELVVLLLMRASAMQQKCRHADSSRGRVPQWNVRESADRSAAGFCFVETRGVSGNGQSDERGT